MFCSSAERRKGVEGENSFFSTITSPRCYSADWHGSSALLRHPRGFAKSSTKPRGVHAPKEKKKNEKKIKMRACWNREGFARDEAYALALRLYSPAIKACEIANRTTKYEIKEKFKNYL